MTSLGINNYTANQNVTPSVGSPAIKDQKTGVETAAAKAPETEPLGLTEEGKKLIGALKEVDDSGQALIDGEKSIGDHIESFTYGALGIDHPNEAKKIEDDSYSAGQYLKGALTVGGLLLAIV
tara:strand:+ start:30428 stop:30796 length:369 start_codon:yes stop_codon:yes gene_type:complete